MNIKSIIYICLTVLGVYVSFEPQALAQTRLGLHVTQEELNIWRQRAQSGPYRVAGDVSTNSPGDWTAIVNRAKTFAGSPLMDNWQGQTGSGRWFPDGHSCNYTQGSGQVQGCVPTFSQGISILAAGFTTLVDPNNHNYASQIRTALLTQIAYTGTNFLDTNKWPDEEIGDGYSWQIAQYLLKLVFAYDYVRMSQHGSVFSTSDRQSIEQWFSNAAYYWAKNVNYLIVNNAFPSRNSQFDTTINIGGGYKNDITVGNGPGGGHPVYFNCNTNQPGPFGGTDHSLWNNRSGSQITFAAAASLLNGKFANDAQTQRWVKMWFKEWLTYATFPDGTFADWDRWKDDYYNQGWIYSAVVVGSMSMVADMFARLGDTSLYDFSTSAGWNFGANNPPGFNANTTGGPKTLLKVMQTHSSLVPQQSTLTPNWRSGETNAVCSNSAQIIGPAGSNPSVHDLHYLQGNLYYKDAIIKSHHLRQTTGAPPYPSNPSTNSNPWGGVSAAYPGVLFMFGQMEGKVSPYGGAPASPPPPPQSPPTTSAIMVDSTFPGYSTSPVDDGVRDAFGGTATTWASGENSSAPHWIEIPLPSSQQINTATIHWAYNDTTYMTSQEMQVQYWNGSSFVTAATMTWPGKDVPSTTVTFPTVTTSKLRFYQPPNQGHPNYPEVIWLAEIDFGGSVTPNPAAPTNLVVAFE